MIATCISKQLKKILALSKFGEAEIAPLHPSPG